MQTVDDTLPCGSGLSCGDLSTRSRWPVNGVNWLCKTPSFRHTNVVVTIDSVHTDVPRVTQLVLGHYVI